MRSGNPLAWFRNEFRYKSLSRRSEKYLVVGGEYIWKYTHNGYDWRSGQHDPFPIEWHNSKIPGYAMRAACRITTASQRWWLCPALRPGSSHSTDWQLRYYWQRERRIRSGPNSPRPNISIRLHQLPAWKRGPWFGFNGDTTADSSRCRCRATAVISTVRNRHIGRTAVMP